MATAPPAPLPGTALYMYMEVRYGHGYTGATCTTKVFVKTTLRFLLSSEISLLLKGLHDQKLDIHAYVYIVYDKLGGADQTREVAESSFKLIDSHLILF